MDLNPPRQPTAAIMVYSAAMHESVSRENPQMSAAQIGKICATMYQALSDEEKQPYREQAAADMARYERELVVFKQASQAAQDVDDTPSSAAAA